MPRENVHRCDDCQHHETPPPERPRSSRATPRRATGKGSGFPSPTPPQKRLTHSPYPEPVEDTGEITARPAPDERRRSRRH